MNYVLLSTIILLSQFMVFQLILAHVTMMQKKRGFDLHVAMGVLSICGLSSFLLGIGYDINWEPRGGAFLWYRAFVYTYLTNGLFAAYGYTVLALSFDR